MELSKIASYNCDPLRDVVPFAQFKKREKHPHVFYIVQMVPNHSKHHIYRVWNMRIICRLKRNIWNTTKVSEMFAKSSLFLQNCGILQLVTLFQVIPFIILKHFSSTSGV